MTDIKLGKSNFQERLALGEKNDCTVVSLANALEVDYLVAYGMAIGAGRRKGKCIAIQGLYTSLAITYLPRPNMSVERFVKSVIGEQGNWIIQIRGHVFAVCSGEIRDTGYVAGNLKCHVMQAWRMK